VLMYGDPPALAYDLSGKARRKKIGTTVYYATVINRLFLVRNEANSVANKSDNDD
jgi:hypothetical protein